jgi:uncharacterized protein (TIGR02001 family)
MLRSVVRSTVAIGILTLAPSMASAQIASGDWGAISGSVAAMTDYVFRGVSQTTKGPAVQGALEYTKEVGPVTPYAGIFASNVKFPDTTSRGNLDAKYEFDVMFGVRGDIAEKFKWDVGYIRYMYPQTHYPAGNSMSLDWTEIGVKTTYDLGFATPVFNYFHSQNYSIGGGKGHYFQTGVDVPLPWDVTFSGRIGRLLVENNANLGLPDYTDWSLGVGRDFPEIWGLNIALTYTDTSVKKNEHLSNQSDSTTGNVDERVYDTASPRIFLAVTKKF